MSLLQQLHYKGRKNNMSEFDAGMSRMRKAIHIVESLGKLYKLLQDSRSENEHLMAFAQALQQKDPTNPIVNEGNVVFYDTAGIGPNEIQKFLDEKKIPNATYIQESDGHTVIAVPKQYSYQANVVLGAYKAVQPTHAINEQEKELLKVLENNKASGTMPSPLVTRGLKSGYVSIYSMSPGASIAMSKKLSEASIPHATVTTNDGTHHIITNSMYNHQFSKFENELHKSSSFISRPEFMKKNVGQQVIEHKNLTEGQVFVLRKQLIGSGFECNLERQSNIVNANMQAMREQVPGLTGDTYVLRYNAEYAKQIEPMVAATLVQCNGINRDALETYATRLNNIAHHTLSQANQGQSLFIVDAIHPDKRLSIDKSGLRDSTGTLIASPQSKQYGAQVHAAIKSMTYPITKEVTSPGGKRMEDVFTREEIAKAQEGWARTQPDEAGLAASKLAALKVSTDLSAANANIANVCNDAALTAETLSNGIEEGTYRYSAEEVYKIMDMTNIHDAEGVTKQVQELQDLDKSEKTYLEKLVKEDPDKALRYIDKLKQSGQLSGTEHKELTQSIEKMDDNASRFIQAVQKMPNEQQATLTNNMNTFAQYTSMHCVAVKTIGIQDLGLQDIEEHFDLGTDERAPEIGRTEIDTPDVGAPVLEGDI
jgi:hypothetical protein